MSVATSTSVTGRRYAPRARVDRIVFGHGPSSLGERQSGGQRAELQQRLDRAALTLFGTRGLQATTVPEIAAVADVGRQTFFNYFAAKEGVLVQFYRGAVRLVAENRDRRSP